MLRVKAAFAVLSLALAAGGCGPRATAGAEKPGLDPGQVRPVQVDDDELAEAVSALVRDPGRSPERRGLLVGVVRRQLERAGKLFERGHEMPGLATVAGALYLVRAGEYHPSMLDGGHAALQNAVDIVARTGNEGRSLALYSMLRKTLPPGSARQDAKGHLQALRDWAEATRSRGPLQAAGHDQRVAVDLALFYPSDETLRRARVATSQWILLAMDYSKEQLPPSNPFERDEALEAYRAVRTGALVLAALYLRHGDADGALAALDEGEVARVVSPNLRDALSRAAEDQDPEGWFELFHTFDGFATADAEVPFDDELAAAAAWGSAVELYRVDPETMRGLMPVATWLLRHWMPEAAMPLIAPVIEQEPDARRLSWALAYTLQAITNEEAVDDLAAARRVFEGAKPLLRLARTPTFHRKVTPGVARLEYVMGAIEARSGKLERARRHLQSSAESRPTMSSLELLAAIDRQRGATVRALESLEVALRLATRAGDPAAVAETLITTFEVHRDSGNARAAGKALDRALRRALEARKQAQTSPERARAERLLARALEHYGDEDGARRALDRAFDAAYNDQGQMTVTVLEASRRALTQGDLRAGREAARRAVEANLADEDLVYVALWLKLLENHLGVPSDGTTEEALSAMDQDSGWPATLRAWGTGRLDDAGLMNAAGNLVERTEAQFYTSMAQRRRGANQVPKGLKDVAQSEAIQLVEVTVARDLLAAVEERVKVSLPSDIDLP